MPEDRSLIVALVISTVVAVAAFPLLGWQGSLPLGAAAFGDVALIRSGYDLVRAIAWGLLVAVLIAAGLLVREPLGGVLYGLGAVLFFADFLVPAFRWLWFGKTIE